MQEVRLELTTYDSLQNSINKKSARIEALELELFKVKEEHEAEIKKMAMEGKVRCISKVQRASLIPWEEKEFLGFGDVKKEIEEHFKQGLFNDEIENYKKEQLDNLIKQLAELKQINDKLREEIDVLRHRSLLERILNKY